MNKRLVQINVTCNGSTGRIMEQIQRKAEDEGWEAYSFFGRGKPSNGKCYKIGNKIGIIWDVFLTRVFDKHGHGNKRVTRKLIKKIEEIDPDVIQLHNIHGYYINIQILFKYLKKCNKKIVWTLHDCWAFTGHCAYFTFPKCDKWKKGCSGKCLRKKDYPQCLLKNNAESEYNLKKELFSGISNLTIITPSNWLAQLVKESYLNQYDIKVINNGIDLNIFKPTKTIDIRKKYNIPEDKKMILGVASVWDRRKGLEEFIKLSQIIDVYKYIIVLVGLTSKQIKGLPNNIIGIQRTENIEELANFYTESYVFVNPTLEDNFPTTNLEALACGTQVVTYKTGGSGECITDEIGQVVNPRDYKELNSTINELRKDKFKRKKCVLEAKKCNATKKCLEYIKIYKGEK